MLLLSKTGGENAVCLIKGATSSSRPNLQSMRAQHTVECGLELTWPAPLQRTHILALAAASLSLVRLNDFLIVSPGVSVCSESVEFHFLLTPCSLTLARDSPEHSREIHVTVTSRSLGLDALQGLITRVVGLLYLLTNGRL